MSKKKLVFITGYFGAPIREEADRIASCKGWPLLDLDRAIEAADGRSIARLCMMNGEHAYRNAEYEQVRRLCGDPEYSSDAGGLVVVCGDGILYDEDTRGLILRHELVIVGEDQPLQELWVRAAEDTETYHAFMRFGTDDERQSAFEAHHRRQRDLFAVIRKETRRAGSDK